MIVLSLQQMIVGLERVLNWPSRSGCIIYVYLRLDLFIAVVYAIVSALQRK